MLHLLYGPAASGKTDLLMGRIRTCLLYTSDAADEL